MRAFIINLDSATDRWAYVEAAFAESQLILCRVPAVEGAALKLPHGQYSERLYRWFHGRTPNVRELGCYLSHLRAIEAFLVTNEEHGLIGEDDLNLRPDFDAAIEAALHYSRYWNILRVAGLRRGRPARLVGLFGDYSLCVGFGRLKGTGAYVIDRAAARALLAGLLPMRLPYDHAVDREWFLGLRAAYITPFPASQSESDFLSSVQPGIYPKLSSARRWLTTYPYQVCNETARWLFHGSHYLRFKLARIFFGSLRDPGGIGRQQEISARLRARRRFIRLHHAYRQVHAENAGGGPGIAGCRVGVQSAGNNERAFPPRAARPGRGHHAPAAREDRACRRNR